MLHGARGKRKKLRREEGKKLRRLKASIPILYENSKKTMKTLGDRPISSLFFLFTSYQSLSFISHLRLFPCSRSLDNRPPISFNLCFPVILSSLFLEFCNISHTNIFAQSFERRDFFGQRCPFCGQIMVAGQIISLP